ncbi:MAG: hypothetical protein HUK26_09940, partial [Duodenibacillus sp.]|nr:hypothetical protein [Duodenibacillus sp.]
MRIENAEQLLQSLSASKHFKLEDGHIKTENALVHAFKNLFASAPSIARRNSDLRAAMAKVLADNAMPDISRALVKKGGETPEHLLAAPARRSICQGI